MTGAVSRREVPSRGRSTRVLPSGAVQVEEFPLRKLAARTIRNDEFAATAPVVTPSRLAGYSPSAASDRRGSVDGSSPEPWPTRMRPARDSATATPGALARRCARDAETAAPLLRAAGINPSGRLSTPRRVGSSTATATRTRSRRGPTPSGNPSRATPRRIPNACRRRHASGAGKTRRFGSAQRPVIKSTRRGNANITFEGDFHLVP